MIHLNEIPLDYEPRRKILLKLSSYGRGLERLVGMTEDESAFLCGAIKEFRPKKILEIGVATGGSTAVILQALEDNGASYEMHSIDIAKKHAEYNAEDVGFLATFAKENNLINSEGLRGSHEFHCGKILPQVIDEIGGDIDFVILDTVHFLPGEVLDFLAMLPYLKGGAVVVLHDVALNQYKRQSGWADACATGVLFGAVTAEKFLSFMPEDLFRYPNIAAFRINEQTLENIDNVFLSLILCWKYLPAEEQLVTYRKLYQKFYSAELCEIFQEAVDMNAYNSYLVQHK